MFTKKKKVNLPEEKPGLMTKEVTGIALMNVLHLCRDQSNYSLTLEEIAGVIEGVLDKVEVQALINSLLKSLKK